MFTPDDPSDTSSTSRGTLRLGSIEYRCVRLKPVGLAGPIWSLNNVSDEDQVRFLAVYTAFKDVIERHGPEVFLVDATNRVVYVEEIEGKTLRDFIFDTNWDSP